MANKNDIKKCWDLEGIIVKKIKQFETDRTQIIGMIELLRCSNDYEMALTKYGIFLDKNYNISRNDLFEEADKIRKNT